MNIYVHVLECVGFPNLLFEKKNVYKKPVTIFENVNKRRLLPKLQLKNYWLV